MRPGQTPQPIPSRRRARALTAWCAASLAVSLVASTALGDSITLRSAIRARNDSGAILLRDVADVRGDEASRYAEIVIATVPAGSPAKEIGVEEIRRRLEQAGANWARIDLEGRRVVIRPRLSESAGALGACAPVSVEPLGAGSASDRPRGSDDGSDGTGALHGNGSGSSAERGSQRGSSGNGSARGQGSAGAEREGTVPRRVDPRRAQRRGATEPVLASALDAEHSVRSLVADMLTHALEESTDALRIAFDGLDPATLAETPTAVRIEIEPIGVLDGDRVEFAVRWWRDGRVERRTNLSAFPEVARIATVATRDLRKGDQPGEEDLEAALCWLRPSERLRALRPGAIGGRSLASGVRAGDPILESHLEKQLLVKRGDRIVVRSIVGSIAISVDAIAQSDGREGESIECVRTGSGNRQKSSFVARVTARGEAVMAPSTPAGSSSNM